MTRPYCQCFEARYSGRKWSETQLHSEQQNTECDAWKRLLELIEIAATDKRKVFAPGCEIEPEEWHQMDFASDSDRYLTALGECLFAKLY